MSGQVKNTSSFSNVTKITMEQNKTVNRMDNALQEALCQQLILTGARDLQVFLKFAIVPPFFFSFFSSFFNGPMIKCGSQVIQYSTAQTPLPSTPENEAADNDYKGIVKIIRIQRD